jgi:hypothetical protein
MFCANCGSQIKAELNYCNRCGTRVVKMDSDMQKPVADNLSSAIGYIGGSGLFCFIFIVLILVKNNVNPTVLVAISLAYLCALFGICSMILQHLKTLPGKSQAQNMDFQGNFQSRQLDAATTAQLEEPREMPISVTENTTRTLDKVKSKN